MPTCSRNKDIIELRDKLSTEFSIALMKQRDDLHDNPMSGPVLIGCNKSTCLKVPVRPRMCSPQQLLQYPSSSHLLLIWPPLPRSHTATPKRKLQKKHSLLRSGLQHLIWTRQPAMLPCLHKMRSMYQPLTGWFVRYHRARLPLILRSHCAAF